MQGVRAFLPPAKPRQNYPRKNLGQYPKATLETLSTVRLVVRISGNSAEVPLLAYSRKTEALKEAFMYD